MEFFRQNQVEFLAIVAAVDIIDVLYWEKIKNSLNLISWQIFQKLMGTYFLNDHYVTQGPTGKIFQLAIAGQTGII